MPASQAPLRNLINDHSGVTAAIWMHQNRYAALPGENSAAAGRWPGTRNGTGDGVLSGDYDDAPPAVPSTMAVDVTIGETTSVWWHLRLAGLIPEPTLACP
jgi:hypothetical protein